VYNLKEDKMKVTIIGKTDVVLSLNEVGIQIQGKVGAKDIEIDTDAKKNEIAVLERSGLIEVIYDEEKIDTEVESPVTDTSDADEPSDNPEDGHDDNGGFDDNTEEEDGKIKKVPTIEIPEPKSEEKQVAEAEAETQAEGSRVVISTGDETVETKMTKSAVGDVPESEATKASLEAMKKIEEEEDEDNEEEADDKPPVAEEDLPPEEQMGRGAVVMEEGADKKVDMVNSAIPGSEDAKDRDPFIDREEKKEKAEAEKKAEEKKASAKPKETGEESQKPEKKPEENDDESIDGIFTPNEDDPADDDDSFIEW
jgi:hypothetical protein